MKKFSRTSLYSALIITLAGSASGTVLVFDFDPTLAIGNLISQDYGDNVTAITEGSFIYGSDGGFTPNVTVEYFGNSTDQALSFWTTGYSNLTNIARTFHPE